MTRSRYGRGLAAAWIVVVLAAAGCSVLRVDVDVYKGPLANHEDVQTEQLAALAVGAKPLLIQLRDQLEWGRDGPPRTADGTLPDWYRFAFVPDFRDRLNNAFARQVNSVLYLYEDEQEASELDELVERARATAGSLQAAFPRFRPLRAVDAQRAWNVVDDAFIVPETYGEVGGQGLAQQLRRHPAVARSADRPEQVARALVDLRDGWTELLLDGRGRGDLKIRRAHDQLRLFAPSGFSIRRLEGFTDDTAKRSANWFFAAAADEDVLVAHAELLFGSSEGDAARRFATRARDVSAAYAELRRGTVELWQLGLRIAAAAAARVAEDPRLRALRDAAFERAVDAIDVVSLVAALDRAPQVATVGRDVLALRAAATESLGLFTPDSRWRDDGGRIRFDQRGAERSLFELVPELLRTRFALDPVATVEALLELQELVRSDALFADYYALGRSFVAPMRRQYGVVRGPSHDVEMRARSASDALAGDSDALAIAEWLEMYPGSAGGLEAGRPARGLEQLIEDYLATQELESTDAVADPRADARERLFVALIHFAQKVAYLANNTALVTLDEDLDEDATRQRQYVSLLQSIGNSIIAQVDELRQREAHTRRLARAARGEATAIVKELEIPVDEDVDPGTEPPPTKSAAEIWEDLIRRLEVVRLDRALNGARADGPDVAEVDAAIAFARERANRMIYLRPAMSYLRSSFPVSTLQDDAGLRRNNMLADQMHRTLFLGQGDPADDAETLREIDRQSWQTINSIRLAGGGSTNYVLAKDDVGNWYVKGYSSDPSQIIESAKNLALFTAAAGGGDPALLRRVAAEVEAGEGAVSPPSLVARQVEAIEAKFTAAAVRDADDVVAFARELPDALRQRWQAAPSMLSATEVDTLLDVLAAGAAGELRNAILAERAADEEPAARVLDDLRRLHRWRLRAVGQLEDAAAAGGDGGVDLDDGQRRVVSTKLLRHVLAGVERLAERRRRSVAAYREALAAVADSLGDDDE